MIKNSSRLRYNKTELRIIEFVNTFKYLNQKQLLCLFGKCNVGSPYIRVTASNLSKEGIINKVFYNRNVYYVSRNKNLLNQAEHKLAIVKVALSKYYQLQGQSFQIYVDSKLPHLQHARPDLLIKLGDEELYYEVEISRKDIYDVNQKFSAYYKDGILNKMRFIFLNEAQKNRYANLIDSKYMNQIETIKYKLLSDFNV